MPFWYLLTRRLPILKLNPYNRDTIWSMMENSRITSELIPLNSLTDKYNCLNQTWLNVFLKWLDSMMSRIAPKYMTRQLSALLFWITIQMVHLVSAIGTIVQWSERSVISKRWPVPILPLRSNSALVSVTTPIKNTKTQSNEFVVTCWRQNIKALCSVLTSLAVWNVLLMLIGPDHGKIIHPMILCLRTRGLDMWSCMRVSQ